MSNKDKHEVQVSAAFNVNANKDLTVEAFKEPSPFTPAIDANYQFRPELLRDLLAWWKLRERTDDGLFLTGPTGSGKSSAINQVAARLNWPVQQVNGHSRMEMSELIGHLIVLDGDMVWQDGPLTTAYRHGHLFILDELDLLDPGVTAGLNGIVEGRPLVLAGNGGEVVHPHPDFRFVCTGNTNGGGDSTGLHQGTMQQNVALMDRMWVVYVDYPTKEQELAILKAATPDLTTAIIETMIDVANDVRNVYIGTRRDNGVEGDCEVTLSTRTLIRWANLSWFFQGRPNALSYALDRALGNRATPTTRSFLQEIVQRRFGKSE